MKKLGIIFLLVLLGIYGCFSIIFPHGSWNYKLTLVVETPEGIKTGSAVRKVSVYTEPKIFPEQPSAHTSVKGEAVVVDLGDRGVLFALLKGDKYGSDYGYGIIYQEFPDNKKTIAGTISYYKNLKAKKELDFGKLPMLVRFRDINDPKTVERVYPDELEKAFGPGVKLASATLEMTDEGVTTGLERWLKNWNWVEFNKWQMSHLDNPLAYISRYDFERK